MITITITGLGFNNYYSNECNFHNVNAYVNEEQRICVDCLFVNYYLMVI